MDVNKLKIRGVKSLDPRGRRIKSAFQSLNLAVTRARFLEPLPVRVLAIPIQFQTFCWPFLAFPFLCAVVLSPLEPNKVKPQKVCSIAGYYLQVCGGTWKEQAMARFGILGVVGVVIAGIIFSRRYGLGLEWDKDAAVELFRQCSDRLGYWAMPLYVSLHTLSLALCLPSAVFFEAAASLLFGFFPGVLCVFSAKLLGASLSFWIGRCISIFLSFSISQFMYVFDLLICLQFL